MSKCSVNEIELDILIKINQVRDIKYFLQEDMKWL